MIATHQNNDTRQNQLNLDALSEETDAAITLEQILVQAFSYHQAGQLADAERLYLTILHDYPTQVNANHNMGLLMLVSKKTEASLDYFRIALEASPEESQYWISYIQALIKADKEDDAREVLAYGLQSGLAGAEVDDLSIRLAEFDLSQTPLLQHQQSNLDKAGEQHKKSSQHKANLGKNPTIDEMNVLADLFNQGQYSESLELALEMSKQYAGHGFGWKVLGAVYQQQGLKKQAEDALKKAAKLLHDDAEVHFNLANLLCDQGQIKNAVSIYQRAIKINPKFTQAHYNLGATLKDLNRLKEAEACFKAALKLTPDNALMHSNLGIMLKDARRFKDSEGYFRQALRIRSDFIEAHYHLGLSLKLQARYDEAERCFLDALELDKGFHEARCELHFIYQALGREADLEANLRQLVIIQPNLAEAQFDLANQLRSKGDFLGAESGYKAAISLKPDFLNAYNNLGLLLTDKGRYAEAEACYQKILMFDSNNLNACMNLGIILNDMGRRDESEAMYVKALEIAPDSAQVWSNFSVMLNAKSELKRAEASLKKALALTPTFIDPYINLNVNYLAQGKPQQAEAISLQALQVNPEAVNAYNNLLFALTYSSALQDGRYLEYAKAYGHILSKKAEKKFTQWGCKPKAKRLRVGLVSGDFRQHAVAYFLENIIQHIDHSHIELVAYATDSRNDDTTNRLKSYFWGWRSLVGLTDEAAANMIHHDKVHVLIDLSGHTAGNRLPVFAWKPAPVQVSWLGYWASTGVAEIDYVLADAVSVPLQHQTQFVEKIKYLPDTRLCFTEPQLPVEVSSLPALSNGYITFGCFQARSKVSDEVLALWSDVLKAVPRSHLYWQCKSFADTEIVNAVKQQLKDYGVNPENITLRGFAPRADYFAAHANIDVLLDTFPFTGGTTTCEALWLGVPTLTVAGETMIARQGAGLLMTAGLPEWVVEKADYVNKAISLTADLKKLAELRAGLRTQVLASPLFNGQAFAENLEAILWEMWHDKAKSEPMQQTAAEDTYYIKAEPSKPTKFIIVAPYYNDKSAGIVVMHQLCDSLNKLGYPSAMVLTGSGQYTFSNDSNCYGPDLQWYALEDRNECQEFIQNGIVIYPEIVTGNPLEAPRVVRYVLNNESFVARNKMEASEDDFIMAFSPVYHKNPHAILVKLPAIPLFNTDNTVNALERNLDITYIGKGDTYNNHCFIVPNTLEVTRQWPETKAELASIFKKTRYIFSWDYRSQTVMDAILCGAIPVFMSSAPYASFDDLDDLELSKQFRAAYSIEDGLVKVTLPENHEMMTNRIRSEYTGVVNSYESRLQGVMTSMLKHFSISDQCIGS